MNACVPLSTRMVPSKTTHLRCLLVFVVVSSCLALVSSKPANPDEGSGQEPVANMVAEGVPVPAETERSANFDVPGGGSVLQELPNPIPAGDQVLSELPPEDQGPHGHAEEEECIECKASEEAAKQEAEEKRKEDAKKYEEEVKRYNVKDPAARAVAEQMKDKPFEVGDLEEIMHGGHHVHGQGHDEGHKEKATGVDMGDILGQPGPEEPPKDESEPNTVDADEFMHFGNEAHEHENPHEEHQAKEEPQGPMVGQSEDMLQDRKGQESFGANMDDFRAMDAPEFHGKQDMRIVSDVENPDAGRDDVKRDIGIDVERMVHGEEEDHVHDDDGSDHVEVKDAEGNVHVKKRGKVIKYEDILALGLSEEALRGIDMSKLLSENEAEYKDWQKENKDPSQMTFWEQLDELRRFYFGSDSKKIKDVSKVTADDVEWETDGEADSIHDGETQLEHDMEMFGSTRAKRDRKPYKEMRGEDL